MKIYADQKFMNRGIDVHIIDGNAMASPLAFETITDNAALTPPVVTLKNSEAQDLMDELWRAGVRPSEGSGSAGSLKATENHLEDMRRIVFHQIGKFKIKLEKVD